MAKKLKMQVVSVDPTTFESVVDVGSTQYKLGASYTVGDWDKVCDLTVCDLTGLGAGQILKRVDREMTKAGKAAGLF